MQEQLFGFQVSRQEDSGEQYLIFTSNHNADDIIGYQVDMLLNNKIPGLSSVFMKEMDSRKMLLYRITGFMTLEHYLRINRTSSSEMLRILIMVLQSIHNSKAFLLSEDSYLLDPGYIFIHPQTGETAVVYLPVDIKQVFSREFQALIVRLIIQAPSIETSDKIIQKILNALRGEPFNIPNFIRQLKTIQEEYQLPEDAVNADTGLSHAQHYHQLSQKMMAAAKETMENPRHNSSFSWPPHENGEQEMEQSGVKKQIISKKIFPKLLLLTGAAGFSTAVASMVPGVDDGVVTFIKAYGSNYLMTGIGVLGLCGLSIIGFFLLYPKIERKKEEETRAEVNQSAPNPGDFVAAALDNHRDETAVLTSISDETTLLSGSIPLLKALHREETIIICSSDFTIGRNQEICDYAIKNRNIGRIHARITSEREKYYLTDIDSKNGTFLNGKRLVSRQPYELNQGDHIVFASEEFKFLLN